MATDQLDQKAFSAAIAPDQEAAKSAALGNGIQIFKKSRNLIVATDRYIGRTATRHNARTK
jgi:hypothetical protein